ncbi:DUF4270 domain-containing protein [Flavobacterium microcysteis]|uniref:DUF4270 domain-containing protein n=1 Tax=Flavobacterium microcysteis TaxID=2596891 RepID=A0A501Q9C6_9FLAO|nr:DUF4270 domain-containing protein [Flavobacterium microcysteis]TPD68571.1 DUF4270 domain-containing protein [Flavobacterium microcysteis]
MLNNSTFKKLLFLIVGTGFVISCDSEYNSIGADIVDDNDHFGFIKNDEASIVAFSQKTNAVQSNNLPINPLGVFDNGLFGKTTANFVTQVELKTENPTFREVPTVDKIKSVVLNIPYYSTHIETKSDGSNTYELDSVYGNIENKLRLKVYENGYYLRDFDPNSSFTDAQKFYSDQNAVFNNAKGQQLNDSDFTEQNEFFVFSPEERVTRVDGKTIREIPGMRLDLNKQFFYDKIIAGSSNLVNNNVFKNHFRGLYFQVEEVAGSSMAMLNFSSGTITMTYEDKKIKIVNGEEVDDGVQEKTLVLNLKGNTVSLLDYTPTGTSQPYDNLVSNPVTGDQKLYLRGGNGSVAMIDLFGGGNSQELETLRAQAISGNWLINEANLVFYADQPAMQNNVEPKRIYVYNAKDNRPLTDYLFDLSSNGAKPKYGKRIFDGMAKLTGSSSDVNRRVIKYKVRITEHIKNVLFKDSTNVRLGVAVTEDITKSTSLSLRTPQSAFTKVPLSSVIDPLGTVLYGTVPVPANENKRLKLEIYYTKPN